MLDRVRELAAGPGSLGARFGERLLEIGGIERATLLGAQAFTSLIPYLVVASALVPTEDRDFSETIIERFDLEGSAAEGVRSLFASAGEVESAITFVSVGLLLITTLSFTRALQKTYERSFRLEASGLQGLPRTFLWLGVLALWISFTSVRSEIRDLFGPFMSVSLAVAFAFILWLWTPLVLLGGRVPVRRLVPGALVSGVCMTALFYASAIYMPILIENSAERYGLIGVAFSLQGWLLTLSLGIVAGAVAGGVLSEETA